MENIKSIIAKEGVDVGYHHSNMHPKNEYKKNKEIKDKMDTINTTLLSYINNHVFYNTLKKIHTIRKKTIKYVKRNFHIEGNKKILYKFVNYMYIKNFTLRYGIGYDYDDNIMLEILNMYDNDETFVSFLNKDAVCLLIYFFKKDDMKKFDKVMSVISAKYTHIYYILLNKSVYNNNKKYGVKIIKKLNDFMVNHNINKVVYDNTKNIIIRNIQFTREYGYEYFERELITLTKNVKNSYIRYMTEKIINDNFETY